MSIIAHQWVRCPRILNIPCFLLGDKPSDMTQSFVCEYFGGGNRWPNKYYVHFIPSNIFPNSHPVTNWILYTWDNHSAVLVHRSLPTVTIKALANECQQGSSKCRPWMAVIVNRIWWLCLVPTSTTKFATIWYSYTRKIFVMHNDINFLNMDKVESNACQVYDAECVSKIKTILSIIFIFTIWGCVSSAYPILLWWSRECVLYLIIIIKPEVWIINHCLGLGHETMVCAVCLTMFLWNEEHDISSEILKTILDCMPRMLDHNMCVSGTFLCWFDPKL